MIRGVHHLNFLVRDLEAGIERFGRLLGLPVERRDDLPSRGVRTARFRVGDTWIVLVEPLADGEPRRHLERHGEGLFLLSFGVDDVDSEVERLRAAGGSTPCGTPRAGLDGWKVIDVEEPAAGTVVLQFCEEPGRTT